MDEPYYQLLLDSCNSTSEQVLTYLHNTKNIDTAQNIIESGFNFQSHLDYSSDLVSIDDPITIKYFTCIRQYLR